MASRFWVGGSATWDGTTTANWAATSGGASGVSVPTAADDVFIDANSGVNTVTLSASSVCRSLNCTGFTGTVTHPTATTVNIGTSTAGASNIALKLVAGMTWLSGGNSSILQFVSTSATVQTIDFGGKTTNGTIFNGVGGSWQLVSNMTIGTGAAITFTNGTLDTNNQACSWGIPGLGVGTKTLMLGSSVITIIGSGLNFNANSSGFTLNPGTSSIIFNPTAAVAPTFTTGSLVYYNVSVIKSSGGFSPTSGSPTFHNFTCDNTVLGGGNRVLTFDNGVTVTINGTLTYKANNATNRGRMTSNVAGLTTTIALGTTGILALTDADIEDIAVTGTNTPVSATSGRLGDGGGNSGFSFTAPVTYYWIGNGGAMNDPTKYSTTSGGTAGTVVPLIHDVLVFDSNSITIAAQNIANDLLRAPSIDFTNVLNNPTFNPRNPSGGGNAIYGSLILKAGMSYSLASAAGGSTSFGMRGRGSYIFDQAAIDLTINTGVSLNAPGGSLTLANNFTTGNGSGLNLSTGMFNANGFNVTATLISSSNTNARTVSMGSGTWTLTGTGTVWQFSTMTNLTFDAGTSTLAITDTSASTKTIAHGGAMTLNNLTFGGGTGALIFGSNALTINTFTMTTAGILTFATGTGSRTTFSATPTLGAPSNTATMNSATGDTTAYITIPGNTSFANAALTDINRTYTQTAAITSNSASSSVKTLGKTAVYIASSVTGTNIITNSDFESGISPWTQYGGNPAGTLVQSTDFAYTGSNSAKVVNSSAPDGGGYDGGGSIALGSLVIGQTYNISVWARGAVGGENLNFYFNNDANNRQVSFTLTTGWVRYSHTVVANSGGATLYIRSGTANATWYFDNVVVGAANTVVTKLLPKTFAYSAASTTALVRNVGKVISYLGLATTQKKNLVSNPSFETGLTGWGAYQGNQASPPTVTQDATNVLFGSNAAMIVTPGVNTNNGFNYGMNITASGLTVGQTYTLSAWAYTTVITDGSRTQFNTFVSSGSTASNATQTWVSGWQRITNTFVAGSSSATLYVRDSLVSHTYWVDGVQLEAAATATTYFDGSMPGYQWLGTANASASQQLISAQKLAYLTASYAATSAINLQRAVGKTIAYAGTTVKTLIRYIGKTIQYSGTATPAAARKQTLFRTIAYAGTLTASAATLAKHFVTATASALSAVLIHPSRATSSTPGGIVRLRQNKANSVNLKQGN